MNQPTRPFYYRLLRLNHIRLRAPVMFALFEGSIGVAVLLALAEFVSWWGVLAIPAAVALMVKLNDIVAGVATRPLAFAHLGAPRLASGVIIGRSPVPRPSRITTTIGDDDAVLDPAAKPDSPPTARGRATSVARGVAAVPADQRGRWRPMPGTRSPHRGEPAVDRDGDADRGQDSTGDGAQRPDQTGRRNQGRFTS